MTERLINPKYYMAHDFRQTRPVLHKDTLEYSKATVCVPLKLPEIPIGIATQTLLEVKAILEAPDRAFDAYNTSYLSPNPELQAWLDTNISKGLSWFVIIFGADSGLHKDPLNSTRLSYYLDIGNPDIQTFFYNDAVDTILSKKILENKTWYLLKTDVFHGFTGLERGCYRAILSTQLTKGLIYL